MYECRHGHSVGGYWPSRPVTIDLDSLDLGRSGRSPRAMGLAPPPTMGIRRDRGTVRLHSHRKVCIAIVVAAAVANRAPLLLSQPYCAK